MTEKVERTEEQRKQLNVWGILMNLRNLPKTNVKYEKDGADIKVINITHEQQYVPDFRLEWCNTKKHFRVYILIADRERDKTNAGYCICTIGTGLGAVGFAGLYTFLHKHRANNKEAAFAS